MQTHTPNLVRPDSDRSAGGGSFIFRKQTMTWIESHTTMRTNKKLIQLCNELNISRAQAIGHLHMLWWWAIDNRENGDLTGLFDRDIANACDWDKDPKMLIDSLHSCGWIKEYKINDWGDYAGKLLGGRERIRRYRENHCNVTETLPVTKVKRTTIPYNTNNKDLVIMFDKFYSKYPKKVGKAQALKAFLRLSPTNSLFSVILTALDGQSKSEPWTKDGGRFIPHPATWINGKRWEDEIKICDGGKNESRPFPKNA